MELKYPDGKIITGSIDEISQLLNGENRAVKVKYDDKLLNGLKRRCVYCGDLLKGKQQKICGKDSCIMKAKEVYGRKWRRNQRALRLGKVFKIREPNGQKCATCGDELTGMQKSCCGKRECVLSQALERERVRRASLTQKIEAIVEPLN